MNNQLAEPLWIKGAAVFILKANREKENWFLNDQDALKIYESSPSGAQVMGAAGNFMANPVTSWCNSQTAPPRNHGGFDDG